jgi:FAD/FMN-containing dehydrogenase
MTAYQSWGRYPTVTQQAEPVYWSSDPLPVPEHGSILPHGLGRSYGDVCLNNGGVVMPTRGLNRFISFDETMGVLRCEAGVSLAEILNLGVPRGWFLPVTPGTRHVTIGGAIANDVHGKNHHRAGTFGCHVRQFELVRSDGRRLLCSPRENTELFAATIGGMGLTGLITWAEIQLIPIKNRYIDTKSIKFGSLEDFFALSAESEKEYDYTVSWIDCLARGKSLGRGLFMCGNHSQDESRGLTGKKDDDSGGIPVPIDFPGFFLNSLSVKLFNLMYYHRQLRRTVTATVDYNPFFYPLDAVDCWNRIYGKRGLLQYQCVVPHENAEAIRDILGQIAASGQGSFLAVLKVTGDVASPGMLSFPKPGVTLALDFPIKGEKTFALFRTLDAIVREAGGRLYPAKDACMSADDYQAFYPNWREFAKYIDPAFSSSFWRRVTGSDKESKS